MAKQSSPLQVLEAVIGQCPLVLQQLMFWLLAAVAAAVIQIQQTTELVARAAQGDFFRELM
jgi:hypothetical protein